jgi:hypothetical protein
MSRRHHLGGLAQRMEPRRASSIRVRSDERCTMTGCSPAVRTLVALKRFASPRCSATEDNPLGASLRDTSRSAIA